MIEPQEVYRTTDGSIHDTLSTARTWQIRIEIKDWLADTLADEAVEWTREELIDKLASLMAGDETTLQRIFSEE